MSSNWSNPQNTTPYASVLSELKSRDDDLARGLDPARSATPTNPVAYSIRWNSASNKDEIFNGVSWVEKSTLYAINISGSAGTITSTLPVSKGGTGSATALTQFGVKYALSATAESTTSAGTTGYPLIANTASGPAFGKLALGGGSNVSGQLAVANGGTGAASLTDGGILVGNGASPIGIATGLEIATAIGATFVQNANFATTATSADTAGSAGIADDLNTSGSYQINSLGVGVAATGTAGQIVATGNITAGYSDDRLKTRLGVIENALDKVDQLTGFYYQPNEIAVNLGYTIKREVGVSAQDVKRVFPEATSPAPIDNQYMTVHYERLTALLIEAVKELRQEVNQLKCSVYEK